MAIARTNRDEEIIETLTLRVHLASLEQIQRTWWGQSERSKKTARERLRSLERDGMIERRRVTIHPMLAMEKPEMVWTPGEAMPRLGPVAYRLQKRWTEPMKLSTVFIASRKAANEFGGFGGKFKHRTQLTHDIHVAELYLRLLEKDQSTRERWIGEEVLGRDLKGETVPDAILKNSDGLPELIIDFGGRYDTRRLRHFHEHCQKRELAYELW